MLNISRNRKFLQNLFDLNLLKNRLYTSRNILQLSERGLWKDRYPETCLEFEKSLINQPQTVYSGFDPTAGSLHIGNLLVLTALIHFQRAGHNIIVLVGGATALVGDPSGRSTERPILSYEDVECNTKSIKNIVQTIFNNHDNFFWKEKNKDALKPIHLLNNINWYNNLNVIPFLRNVGSHMRMKTLLRRPSVQQRIESSESFSFSEFSYQMLQAYDWLHLFKKYNCSIQIGGSDQMGNINCGHELINHSEGHPVTGLTVPLLTTKSGNKFGKSAGNAIWLDPLKTSPFDFYQYFVRVEDLEVEQLLKLLTFLPLKEIDTLMSIHKAQPDSRRAQKKLAEELTLLVHAESGLKKAKKITDLLYGGNVEVLADLPSEDILSIFPDASVTYMVYDQETSIIDVAMAAKCFPDERQALHHIKAGAFYVNMSRVTHPQLLLIQGIHILPNGLSVVKVGKKKFFIIQWK